MRGNNACVRFLLLIGTTRGKLGTSFVLRAAPQWPISIASRSTIQRLSSVGATDKGIPTQEQLSKDPFMRQVEHAGYLIDRMHQLENNEEDNSASRDDDFALQQLLIAQLRHSDGIRGFFVRYLTIEATTSEDNTATAAIPAILRQCMQQVDPEQLVPLACMNVIMPTAMVSMHKDPALSDQSRATAERGVRVLACLLEDTTDGSGTPKLQSLTQANCRAIWEVAQEEDNVTEEIKSPSTATDQELLQYWTDFFAKWGYGEREKKAIATAMGDLLR